MPLFMSRWLPNQGHYDKSCRNVEFGLTVYLLVPDRALVGTRQNAEIACPGRITAQSIQSFVSQVSTNSLSSRCDEFPGDFRRLLEKYNERVDQIENDKSMLIEITRQSAKPMRQNTNIAAPKSRSAKKIGETTVSIGLPRTVAEYFAGIGLVRMGLKPHRWQVRYANDFSEKKFEMYKAFFPGRRKGNGLFRRRFSS